MTTILATATLATFMSAGAALAQALLEFEHTQGLMIGGSAASSSPSLCHPPLETRTAWVNG